LLGHGGERIVARRKRAPGGEQVGEVVEQAITPSGSLGAVRPGLDQQQADGGGIAGGEVEPRVDRCGDAGRHGAGRAQASATAARKRAAVASKASPKLPGG